MMRRSTSSRCATARPSATKRREGFSLIEILVALVVMSIAMLGLAGMLVAAARTATQVSARNARAAEETEQLNYLAALPYGSLDSKAGCVTVSSTYFPHQRCITVTTISGGSGSKLIQLIIRPINSLVKADTTYLTRSVGKPPNPLGT